MSDNRPVWFLRGYNAFIISTIVDYSFVDTAEVGL